MNSSDLLIRNVRENPLTEAVVCHGRRISYCELNEQVTRLSHALLNCGVEQGDRVIIFMPNVVEFIISYFAVQRIGSITVPTSARYSKDELENVIRHSGACVIIVHDSLFTVASEISNMSLKIKTGAEKDSWLSFETLISTNEQYEIPCLLNIDAPASIMYTSGTTGMPKGVLFSYRNILTVANGIAVELEMKTESRVLLMMPLTNAAPLHLFMMAGMLVGATIILTPTFMPDLMIETIEQEKVTHFFAAPIAYMMTAMHPKLLTADLSSMQCWVYGFAPLSNQEVQLVQQVFQTGRLACFYGLTEAGPSGTIFFHEEHGEKYGSVGKRAMLNTKLRIVNEFDEDVEVNEIGEIILLSEGNMLGYYNDEDTTEAVLKDGWIKTGDLAYFDRDGYIWIVDRKKDVIISEVLPKEEESSMLIN